MCKILHLQIQKISSDNYHDHLLSSRILTATVLLGAHIKTDPRGKNIEKLLERHNIVILNNDEQTTINPSNRNHSVIDLTFNTPTIAQRLHWQVLNEIYNNDHLPICIELISNAYKTNYSTIKWNLKNPNWSLFSNLFETKINSFEFPDDHLDIEKAVSKFTRIILETVD